MVVGNDRTIEIHQCLFGYKDGHRLLASSTDLPQKILSVLLPLSDLAPGVGLAKDQSYWTGVPLRDMRVFALLRTWSAPEMSRPGCVWTHVLLVPLAGLRQLTDLDGLRELAIRPSNDDDFALYRSPVRCEIPPRLHLRLPLPVNDGELVRLVRGVYGPHAAGRIEAHIGALDIVVFALWSQQWPQLRSTFTFRTAVASPEKAIPKVRFQLALVPTRDVSPRQRQSEPLDLNSWEAATLDDLRTGGATDFRRFIWHYGADIRQGRERFRHLAEFFVLTRRPLLEGAELESLLLTTTLLLPDAQDGHTFKRELVTTSPIESRLLPERDPVGLVEFFVKHETGLVLPPLPLETITAIGEYWPERSAELLSLGEQVVSRPSDLSDAIVAQLRASIGREKLLASTKGFPNLRRVFVQTDMTLLDSDEIAVMPRQERDDLLDLLPRQSSVLVPVLGRLITLDDRELAERMWAKSRPSTLSAVAGGIEDARDGSPLPALPWCALLARETKALLYEGWVSSSRSTRALAVFASFMGYDNEEVLRAGPKPWVEAISVAKDDVTGRDRQVFLAFLLGLALRRPEFGCEVLLERSFEPIHRDLARSTLPQEALRLFSDQLSNVAWWDQWDYCLRLRKTVVSIYISHGLNPESFTRLTYNSEVFEQITKEMSATREGRKFLRKLAGGYN